MGDQCPRLGGLRWVDPREGQGLKFTRERILEVLMHEELCQKDLASFFEEMESAGQS